MAKESINWGADDTPAPAIKWGEADTPADQPQAPRAAAPAPPVASDTEIDQLAGAGMQPGSASAQLNAEPAPTRTSVLEGVHMPEPQFDPAEGERLSRRANAERADMEVAQRDSPSMRPGDPNAVRASGDGMLGRAGDLIKAQTYSAASGLGRHLATAADTVGAENLAGDLNARAAAASDKSKRLSQSVELERAARNLETVQGFAPGSIVQDSKRFADEYLPQILAQSPQAPMALFGGLAPLVGMSYLSSYADARDAGKTPSEALAYAIPQATFEYAGEKLGGMGRLNAAFEKAMATGFTKDAAWRNLGKAFMAAGAKEVPSEELTYGLQFINDKFSPVGLQPNAGWEDFKKGAADTAIVALGAGGMLAGAGAMVTGGGQSDEPKSSAEQLAKSKGFLVSGDVKPADDPRVKRLREAGEKVSADLLEKRLIAQRLPADIERELGGMGEAAATPEFQTTYRELRTAGIKPVEAAGRTAVITDFSTAATQAGMSDKALSAALEAAKKVDLEKLPGFLHRYAQSLASRGLAQPVDIGAQLEAARDTSMDAALTAAYQEEDEADTAAQTQAVANIENILQPTLETGNDIAVTPEAEAVHQAATSPLNDLAEPTQAQKDAGNYKVGRMRIAGMDISVENPQGSTRRGTDEDGKAWESPMTAHYGYVRGTTAADGDKLDVFVVPGTPEDFRGPAFVVDQINPRTGALDEHKVILGARDEAEAEAIYRSNYAPDWQGLGAITRLPLPAFKAWAATGNKKEPLGDIQIQPQQATQGQKAAAPARAPDQAADAGTGRDGRDTGTVQPDRATADAARAEQPAAVGPSAEQQRADFAATEAKRKAKAARLRSGAFDRNPLMAFLGKHGVSSDLTSEFAPGETERRKAIVPGYGPVFRRAGLNLDLLAERAAEEGFLPPGSRDDRALHDLISRAIRGERIIPQYAEGFVETQAGTQKQASYADFLEAQQDNALDPEGFTETELDESGYNDASEEVQAEVRALIAMAEEQGIDAESVLEEVAKKYENATQQEYHEAAKRAIEDAIAAQPASEGDSRAPAGQESPAPGQKTEAEPVAPPAAQTQQTPADAGVSVSTPTKPVDLIALRKRVSVLKSLRKCLGA